MNRSRFEAYRQQLVGDTGNFVFAAHLLQRTASRVPDSIAVLSHGESLTYRQVLQHANRISHELSAQGVQNGDRVVLLSENSILYHAAYFGIWQTGAVVVPLNVFLTERERAHVLNDSQPKCLVLSSAWNEKLRDAHECKNIFCYSIPPFQPDPDTEYPQFSIPEISPDRLAVILYTSGTTGLPKGVMLNSRALLTNVLQGVSLVKFTESDRVLCLLPLFHSFAQNACLWAVVFIGASVILAPKIDRKEVLNGVALKPTAVVGVPALYGLFCLMRTLDFSSVRYFVSGGDALPERIRTAFALVYGRILCAGFGLTETSPLISINFVDELDDQETVGYPAEGVSIAIRDERGVDLGRGKVGILWVKGDNVMMGYYNAPEQTSHVLQNGWLNTGDCAFLTPLGKLVIVGREKDLIVNKGIKIYPQEVETVIGQHPQVHSVAVIGRVDGDAGQTVIAIVQLQKAAQPEIVKEQLISLCSTQLAAYKNPKDFIFVPELPLTSIGKVDKKSLRHVYGKV